MIKKWELRDNGNYSNNFGEILKHDASLLHHYLIPVGLETRNEFKMAPNVLNLDLQYNHIKPLFSFPFLLYNLAYYCIKYVGFFVRLVFLIYDNKFLECKYE